MKISDEIKERVTMHEVMNHYNFTVKKDFTSCPFHKERTASMRIYDESFYCFGCAEGGDVIKFVQLYFNLDFKSALARLNYDFNLGLPMDGRMDARKRREMHLKAEKLEQTRIDKEREEKDKKNYREGLWDEWIRLDINQMEYKPKNMSESLHPLFVEALHKKPYYDYLINSLP